jgi:DDE superfamily endonuclease
MTHDYKRNGTTNLRRPEHRHRQGAHPVSAPPSTERVPHLLDHGGRQRSPRPRRARGGGQLLDPHASNVKAWLAKHKRVHLHFTPTSSSWLNLVELWFRQIGTKRLSRGVFKTLDDLIDAIDDWTDHWNEHGAPFTWTKTADEILAKVRSARGSLERQIKVATDH